MLSPIPAGLRKGSLFAGRYAIESVIGTGGMGVVYQVLDRQTARRRALKVLSGGAWTSSGANDLPREVLVGAAIDSPYVADVLDAGIDGYTGFPFLAMELLRGEDLARRRLRLGRCPASEVAAHLHQVGRALDAIHAAGVVHRDLKPANIFLCHVAGLQTIKVLDFGIAKLIDRADGLTAGSRAGTPAYMAPEQLRGDTVTPATDVYSFAMVAFELLAGRRYPSHDGPAPSAGMQQRPLAREQIALWELDVELPAAFDDWFARATAPSSSDRFPEALRAADALAAALAVEVSSSPYLPLSALDEVSPPSAGEPRGDQPTRNETPSDPMTTALFLPETVVSQRGANRDRRPGPDVASGSAVAFDPDVSAPRLRRVLLAATVTLGAVMLAVVTQVLFARSHGPDQPATQPATQTATQPATQPATDVRKPAVRTLLGQEPLDRPAASKTRARAKSTLTPRPHAIPRPDGDDLLYTRR